MVAAGVFPRGAINPLLTACSVIARTVIGRRDDLRTATAASRYVMTTPLSTLAAAGCLRHSRPHRFPMCASAAVLWTRPHLQVVRGHLVAVAAARAAGPAVVDPKLDSAQRALGLDNR